MTKVERINKLVEELAQKGIELKKSEMETVLKAIEENQKYELLTEGSTSTPFGIVKVVYRNEKEGRNPQTKEPMLIPARLSLKLSVGKSMKEELATLNLEDYKK